MSAILAAPSPVRAHSAEVLDIYGIGYRVEHLANIDPDLWQAIRLHKPGGEVYDLSAGPEGITCDCPSFEFVKGPEGKLCKHAAAAACAQILAVEVALDDDNRVVGIRKTPAPTVIEARRKPAVPTTVVAAERTQLATRLTWAPGLDRWLPAVNCVRQSWSAEKGWFTPPCWSDEVEANAPAADLLDQNLDQPHTDELDGEFREDFAAWVEAVDARGPESDPNPAFRVPDPSRGVYARPTSDPYTVEMDGVRITWDSKDGRWVEASRNDYNVIITAPHSPLPAIPVGPAGRRYFGEGLIDPADLAPAMMPPVCGGAPAAIATEVSPGPLTWHASLCPEEYATVEPQRSRIADRTTFDTWREEWVPAGDLYGYYAPLSLAPPAALAFPMAEPGDALHSVTVAEWRMVENLYQWGLDELRARMAGLIRSTRPVSAYTAFGV